MKKQLQKLIIVASLALASNTTTFAQTTSDLENLTLSPNTYWNGATSNPTVSTSGNFTSGNAIFSNSYSGLYGGYWASGWAYSNMKDSITDGSKNQYSARTAVGNNNSSNYTIGRGGSKLKFNAVAEGKQLSGFYVTNSTYAAVSMKNGDTFGKKFGGITGNDPDWFKLKIQKYLGGILQPDSVVFYLADFRFANNAQDYIVKNWQFVNLSSLGNADSLVFKLSSSDVGLYGMNTPSYFCLDDFTTFDIATGLEETFTFENHTTVYPNPATEVINIYATKPFTRSEIFNQLGELIITSTQHTIHVNELPSGAYFIKIYNNNVLSSIQKFIKE